MNFAERDRLERLENAVRLVLQNLKTFDGISVGMPARYESWLSKQQVEQLHAALVGWP